MKTTKKGERPLRTTHALQFGLAALALAVSAGSVQAAQRLSIESLSNRPDKLSGGDALIRINLADRASAEEVSITLNGTEIRSVFSLAEDGRSLIGLVEGLQDGRNKLMARARGAGTASLELVSHPLSGPVFAGPKQEPSPARPASSRSTRAAVPWRAAGRELHRARRVTTSTAPPPASSANTIRRCRRATWR